MANEELKETVSLTEYLNVLEQEGERTKKQGNRTLEHRRNLIQEANEHSKDNTELERIRKDLVGEANKYAKAGNKILAKRYLEASKVVTKQIQENKIAEKKEKIEKKLFDTTKKRAEALTGIATSSIGIFGKFFCNTF